MIPFRYLAIDGQGKRQTGQLLAESKAEAVARLQAQRMLIIELHVSQGRWETLFSSPRISQRQLVRLTEQLATLLDAGQPIESVLELLVRQAARGPQRDVVERLLEQVKAGDLLSTALAREDRVFSSFYISLVRAGEASGTLSESLAHLAEHLERAHAQRTELISALIYPAFLVAGVLGSLGLLLAYVVPQFVPIFADLGIVLPLLTKAVLWLGELMERWGVVMALVAAFSAGCVLVSLRDRRRRERFDASLLRCGALGSFWLAVDVARLAQVLGTLLEKRVALLTSLDIARRVVTNYAMRAAVSKAAQETREGASLADALARTRVFPELAVQMIGVGEQSGQLGEMLLKLARIYDKQNQTSIKRFMAALVPTLTLLMTAMVALIMLAILLPLMSLTSNI
ncbi:type II secretion system F family protein [Achromobacter seleniivolatilans]|uniref:Type II secretion system F family protein n=1 Tax=Achromobacter seleniivolatilans TaxID=3047478 RepID=A0ABY9LZK0_9BURK|nr:type II secretion system F family protein [Achromobacter sp. R39]WMD20201.1 type II secretion system F family protein [Achromobacter sp. R39]